MKSCKTCIHCPEWEEETFCEFGNRYKVRTGLKRFFDIIFGPPSDPWKKEVKLILGRCRAAPNAPVVIDYGEYQRFSGGVRGGFSPWSGGGYCVFKNEFGRTDNCVAHKPKE